MPQSCDPVRAGDALPELSRTPLTAIGQDWRESGNGKRKRFGRHTFRMRAKTAVVLGAQWGDEGSHNAGHTVIIHGKKFILQLVPCGVLRPDCLAVIGNGVVLDPMAFLK